MSFQDKFIIPATPKTSESPHVVKRRKIAALVSPDGSTLLDTPTRQMRESAVVQIDDDEIVSICEQSQTDGGSSSDDDTDSAELGEDTAQLLVPTERIAVAVERATEILQTISKQCNKKRPSEKPIMISFIDELWNASTRSMKVEQKLNRRELEVLWGVAHYLRPATANERALPLTVEFVTKQYRLVNKRTDSCCACGPTTASTTDTLCPKCIRILALVRSVLSTLLMENATVACSVEPIEPVPIQALLELEQLRRESNCLRIKRAL